jgi:ankyrin repeat protein
MLAATGRGSESDAILELLLRWGADPDLTDAHGNTALTIASKGQHADAVRILETATAQK